MSRVRSTWMALLLGTTGAAWVVSPAFAHESSPDRIRRLTDELAESVSSSEAARLLWQRGELFRLNQDLRQAEADFTRASSLDPEFAPLTLSWAALLLDRGEPEQAWPALQRFLDEHPEHTFAHSLYAQALEQSGRHEDAAREMGRFLEISPTPRPEHYLQWSGMLESADPASVDAPILAIDAGIVRLGPLITLELRALELLRRDNRPEEALRRLDTFLASGPSPIGLRSLRSDLLEETGRTLEAMAEHTKVLDALETLPERRRGAQSNRELERHSRERLRALRTLLDAKGTQR